MQRSRRLAAILLTILIVLPVTPVLATNAHVGVYVYECDLPAEGITVDLYDGATWLAQATTDSLGYAQFNDLDWLTTYTVVAATTVGSLSKTVIPVCDTTTIITFEYCIPDDPGMSPGYWKGRLRKYLRGQDVDQPILQLISDIGDLHPAYAGWTPQDYLDALKSGNNKYGAWTDLANLFNEAAGYTPY